MNNYELIQFPGPDQLARAAAIAWLDEVASARRNGHPLYVALSGGRITQKFFLDTAETSLSRKIPFDHVHFFWADERCVPPDDPESNYKLACDLLFAPLHIPEAQIHRLRGELKPETAVAQANAEVTQIIHKSQVEPIFDLVFLGMGEDGHVASLFQNARFAIENSAQCNAPFIFVSDSPKPPPHRISLNFQAIITARQVWVLASGNGKKDALTNSLSGRGQTPLDHVIRSRTNTKIFTDINL